jgi:hypothetical protein
MEADGGWYEFRMSGLQAVLGPALLNGAGRLKLRQIPEMPTFLGLFSDFSGPLAART